MGKDARIGVSIDFKKDTLKEIEALKKTLSKVQSSDNISEGISKGSDQAMKRIDALEEKIQGLSKTKVNIGFVSELKEELGVVADAVRDLQNQMETFANSLTDVTSKTRFSNWATELQKSLIGIGLTARQGMRQITKSLDQASNVQNTVVKQAQDNAKKISKAQDIINKALSDDNMEKAARTRLKNFDKVAGAIEKYRSEGDALKKQILSGQFKGSDLDDAVQKFVTAQKRVSQYSQTIIQSFKDVSIKELQKYGYNDIEDVLGNTTDAKNNLKEVLGIIQQIADQRSKIGNESIIDTDSTKKVKQIRLTKEERAKLLGIDFKQLRDDLADFESGLNDFSKNAADALQPVGVQVTAIYEQTNKLKKALADVEEAPLTGTNTNLFNQAIKNIGDSLDEIKGKIEQINKMEISPKVDIGNLNINASTLTEAISSVMGSINVVGVPRNVVAPMTTVSTPVTAIDAQTVSANKVEDKVVSTANKVSIAADKVTNAPRLSDDQKAFLKDFQQKQEYAQKKALERDAQLQKTAELQNKIRYGAKRDQDNPILDVNEQGEYINDLNKRINKATGQFKQSQATIDYINSSLDSVNINSVKQGFAKILQIKDIINDFDAGKINPPAGVPKHVMNKVLDVMWRQAISDTGEFIDQTKRKTDRKNYTSRLALIEGSVQGRGPKEAADSYYKIKDILQISQKSVERARKEIDYNKDLLQSVTENYNKDLEDTGQVSTKSKVNRTKMQKDASQWKVDQLDDRIYELRDHIKDLQDVGAPEQEIDQLKDVLEKLVQKREKTQSDLQSSVEDLKQALAQDKQFRESKYDKFSTETLQKTNEDLDDNLKEYYQKQSELNNNLKVRPKEIQKYQDALKNNTPIKEKLTDKQYAKNVKDARIAYNKRIDLEDEELEKALADVSQRTKHQSDLEKQLEQEIASTKQYKQKKSDRQKDAKSKGEDLTNDRKYNQLLRSLDYSQGQEDRLKAALKEEQKQVAQANKRVKNAQQLVNNRKPFSEDNVSKYRTLDKDEVRFRAQRAKDMQKEELQSLKTNQLNITKTKNQQKFIQKVLAQRAKAEKENVTNTANSSASIEQDTQKTKQNIQVTNQQTQAINKNADAIKKRIYIYSNPDYALVSDDNISKLIKQDQEQYNDYLEKKKYIDNMPSSEQDQFRQDYQGLDNYPARIKQMQRQLQTRKQIRAQLKEIQKLQEQGVDINTEQAQTNINETIETSAKQATEAEQKLGETIQAVNEKFKGVSNEDLIKQRTSLKASLTKARNSALYNELKSGDKIKIYGNSSTGLPDKDTLWNSLLASVDKYVQGDTSKKSLLNVGSLLKFVEADKDKLGYSEDAIKVVKAKLQEAGYVQKDFEDLVDFISKMQNGKRVKNPQQKIKKYNADIDEIDAEINARQALSVKSSTVNQGAVKETANGIQQVAVAIQQIPQNWTQNIQIDPSITENIARAAKALQDLLAAYKEINSAVQKGSFAIDQQQISRFAASLTEVKTQLLEISDIIQRATGIMSSSNLDVLFAQINEQATEFKEKGLKLTGDKSGTVRKTMENISSKWNRYVAGGGTKTIGDLTTSANLKKFLRDNAVNEGTSFNETASSADNAAEAKERFAKANKEVLESITNSINGLQNEGLAFKNLKDLINTLNGKNIADKVKNTKQYLSQIIDALNKPIQDNSAIKSINEVLKAGGSLKDLATVVNNTRATKQMIKQKNQEADRKLGQQEFSDNEAQITKRMTDYVNAKKNANESIRAIESIGTDTNGLVKMNVLLENTNGELRQMVVSSKEAGRALQGDFDIISTSSNTPTLLKKQKQYKKMAEQIQYAFKNSVPEDEMIISKDDVPVEVWEKIVSYATQYREELGEITKITRNVRRDNDGNQLVSYAIDTANGGRFVTGKDSSLINTSQTLADVSQIQSIIKDLTKYYKEYLGLLDVAVAGNATEDQRKRLEQIQAEYQRLIDLVQAFNNAASNGNVSRYMGEQANKLFSDFETQYGSLKQTEIQRRATSLMNQLNTAIRTRQNAGTNFEPETRKKIDSMVNQLENVSKGEFDTEHLQSSISLLQQGSSLLTDIKNKSKELTTVGDVSKLVTKAQRLLNQNNVTGDTRQGLESIIQQLNELIKKAGNAEGALTDLDKISYKNTKNQINAYEADIYNKGMNGKSFAKLLNSNIKSKSASFISQFFSFYDYIRYARQLFQNVLNIDTAMTELAKVSDATGARLQQNFKTSAQTAQELGSTISDVINSTADWSRLGYSVDDAEKLAKATTLLQTVGDNMTQQTASQSLISALKGFGYTADSVDSIVDKYNEIRCQQFICPECK